MPALSYPGNLEITASELLSSRRLNDGVCFVVFLCLYYRAHLNSYYYISDNITSGEPMFHKYFVDFLEDLIRLYL